MAGNKGKKSGHNHAAPKLFFALLAAVCLFAFLAGIMIRYKRKESTETGQVLAYEQGSYQSGYGSGILSLGDAQGWAYAVQPHFIAVSFCGIDGEGKGTLERKTFEKMIAALRASGYITISQSDIEAFYSGSALPDKSMFLLFEDSTKETADAAMGALVLNNCIATMTYYSRDLFGNADGLLTGSQLLELKNSSYFELACSGYEPAYINAFDRYGNFYGSFGRLAYNQAASYILTYDHSLMDFIRDQDGIRTESQQEMENRIHAAYEEMQAESAAAIGVLPPLYLLLHSNTGAFGTDARVSAVNNQEITSRFAMNMNRLGTAVNARNSSIYDLSRLRVKPSFSCNHLLMRIWDDTGDDVAFLIGDKKESENWCLYNGVVEYDGDRIILTSRPCSDARTALSYQLPDEFELDLTLEGTVVGKKGIRIGARPCGRGGTELLFQNDTFVISNVDSGEVLYRLELSQLDGERIISQEQDELNGLILLEQSILERETDEQQIRLARQTLAELQNVSVPSVAAGGTPKEKLLDRDAVESRRLHVMVAGGRMQVAIDEKWVAGDIPVDNGYFAVTAGFSEKPQNLMQSELDDDVMDVVVINPRITLRDARQTVFYRYGE